MALVPKIIKSSHFEDGTFQIKAPPFPHPGMLVAGDAQSPYAESATPEAPGIDPRVLAAEEEATTILAMAREELVAMRLAAQDEVAAARQAAVEAGHAEGLAAGLEQGRTAGHEAGMGELASQLSVLMDAVTAYDREREAREEAHGADLTNLALIIAQKILAVELAHGRESAVPLAQAALKRLTDKTQVRLRVHPLDAEAIVAAKQQLLLSVDGLSQLDIIADAKIGLGGCLLESKSGLVDARLATQLDEIAVGLLDLGVEDGSEMDPLVKAAIRALGRGGVHAGPDAQPRKVIEAPVPRLPVRTKREVPDEAPDPRAAAEAEAQALLAAARAQVEAMLAAAAPVAAPVVLEWTDAAEDEEEAPSEAASEAVEEAVAAPVVEAAPSETTSVAVSSSAPAYDPSRRAAQALAARLGQHKSGKAVLSLQEELATRKSRELTDVELEDLVAQSQMPKTDIGNDQPLVWTAPRIEDAAEALAARLGQKPRTRREVPEGALADNMIASILDGVGVKTPEDEPLPAAAEPNIEKATENLYKMLGQKKKTTKRNWYEALETP